MATQAHAKRVREKLQEQLDEARVDKMLTQAAIDRALASSSPAPGAALMARKTKSRRRSAAAATTTTTSASTTTMGAAAATTKTPPRRRSALASTPMRVPRKTPSPNTKRGTTSTTTTPESLPVPLSLEGRRGSGGSSGDRASHASAPRTRKRRRSRAAPLSAAVVRSMASAQDAAQVHPAVAAFDMFGEHSDPDSDGDVDDSDGASDGGIGNGSGGGSGNGNGSGSGSGNGLEAGEGGRGVRAARGDTTDEDDAAASGVAAIPMFSTPIRTPTNKLMKIGTTRHLEAVNIIQQARAAALKATQSMRLRKQELAKLAIAEATTVTLLSPRGRSAAAGDRTSPQRRSGARKNVYVMPHSPRVRVRVCLFAAWQAVVVVVLWCPIVAGCRGCGSCIRKARAMPSRSVCPPCLRLTFV